MIADQICVYTPSDSPEQRIKDLSPLYDAIHSNELHRDHYVVVWNLPIAW